MTYLEKNEDTRAIFSNTALDLTAGAAFLASLLIIKSRKEKYDKSFLFLAIGLGLWFCGELTYSYYQNLCKVTFAYPTIADLFYLAAYPFVATYFYKTFKVWNETKRVKVYSIIIAAVITAGLVGNHIYLNFFVANGESEIGPECLGPLQYVPRLGTIMELTYYIGDGIILIPAVVIVLNSRIKDPFFLHRILISVAVIILFLADIVFVDYSEGFWWSWLLLIVGDMLYNFSYICFALGFIWYYKITQLINKNIDICVKESKDVIKSASQFIDNDTSQLKESDGIFVKINDADKAYDYLKNLLNTAQREIQVLLSPITLMYIIRNRNVYNLLLEKSAQSGISIKILLPYDKSNDPYISKLNEDSLASIKVQYIKHGLNPSQLVAVVDNKIVLNLEIRNNDPKLDIESAIYSNKESVVMCYINIIEYQSLISEI